MCSPTIQHSMDTYAHNSLDSDQFGQHKTELGMQTDGTEKSECVQISYL